MMHRRAIPTILAAVWIVGGGPVRADPALSVTTLDFLAETRPSNGFLAGSSRLAEARAARSALRAFARREATGRAEVMAAYADWAAGEHRGAAAAQARLDPLSRLLEPADSEAVIDTVPPPPDLARLAALRGQDFDAAFVTAQTQLLEQLVVAYKDFILNGDDQVLRALAAHDLPRARQLLAEVRRLR